MTDLERAEAIARLAEAASRAEMSGREEVAKALWDKCKDMAG